MFLERGTACYWDSYGTYPSRSEGVRAFLQRFERVKKNEQKFQMPSSDVCGQYCIFFCYYMCLGYSFDQFIFMLSQIRPDTDAFVYEFVNKMYN